MATYLDVDADLEFSVDLPGSRTVTGAGVMRTGTGVDVREEYADHGRPYGGRIGGELGYQRPQPPRTYRRARTDGRQP